MGKTTAVGLPLLGRLYYFLEKELKNLEIEWDHIFL